jgi:hypothetical protein
MRTELLAVRREPDEDEFFATTTPFAILGRWTHGRVYADSTCANPAGGSATVCSQPTCAPAGTYYATAEGIPQDPGTAASTCSTGTPTWSPTVPFTLPAEKTVTLPMP